MRRITILLAISLLAAACGSDGTSDTLAARATTVADAGSQSSSTTADAGTTTTAPSADAPTTTSTPPPASTPAALPESDYPDVVVADLAGGDVNLRELALESEPVLLWFWAPH